MNKNKKIITAVAAAVILICALVITLVATGLIPVSNSKEEPGKLVTVTEAVTDENGEPVTDTQGEVVTETAEAEAVTGDSGEIITEVVTNSNKQPYTQKNGSNVTRAVTKKQTTKKSTTKKADNKNDKDNSTTGKKDDDKSPSQSTTKPPVTQAGKPGNITGLKVDDVKKDSFTVKWNKIKCDKYQIQVLFNKKEVLDKETTATSFTVTGLTSYTEYTVRVRALNNSPGSDKGVAGEWAVIKQRTEPNNESRKIAINYTLPVGSTSGEIEIYIKKDGDKEYSKEPDKTVKITESRGTIETKEKYKGLVTVMIKYKNRSAESELTDKEEIKLEITDINIGIANGEDD